jgi:hypothetical protein
MISYPKKINSKNFNKKIEKQLMFHLTQFSFLTVSRKDIIHNHSTFEIKKSMIKKLLFILFSFYLLTSCKKEQPKIEPQTLYKEVITPDDIKTITPQEAKTYHKDIHYHYEYRTGTSGNYKYNYLVSGLDQEGDSVSGVINIKGKYGAGILIDKDQETIDIQAEWIDYNKLKGTDNYGNEYQLEAN